MSIQPRFSQSADDSRPHKSHRFDVYGPKAGRTLTLFGKTSLRSWILLESDPSIVTYCERPILIENAKPKRVADFWVQRKSGEEIWLLLRNRELEGASHFAPSSPFAKWCEKHRIHPKFLLQPDLQEENVFFENWGAILRYMAFCKQSDSLRYAGEIKSLIKSAKNLTLIESRFPDTDSTVIRAVLFMLMHQGEVQCLDIRDRPLEPHSLFVAT